MTSIKRFLAVAATLALSFGAVSAQATQPVNTKYVEGSDPAAAMFNPLVVNEFDLTMPQSTIKGLDGTTNYWGDEGPYLPATLAGKINGVPFGPYEVGVHLKGAWGSWRNIYGKAGLKIKVDYNNKKQTLFGIKKLTLNNMVQDQSSLHETMSYRLFRAVGVPTARTGYVNVKLNGQNYGLRLNLETVDTTLLKRWGITPSHIYKGGVPIFPEFWPGQEDNFVVDQGSLTDKSDLTAMLAVVGRGNSLTWFDEMSAIADLRQMTLNWATEKFTGHWDGYVNNRNNFYLVKRQDGKFIMLPWGMDQTWNGPLNYWDGNILITQCIADTRCLKLYKEALVKVVRTAQELDLPQMSRDTAAVINPWLLADPKKEFGNWEIPANQNPSRNFITSQINNGLWMIRDYDAALKSFSAAGFGSVGVRETLNVPNETKAIRLVGVPYSANSVAATTALRTLRVGLNLIPISVTNTAGGFESITTVKVYRKASLSKTVSLAFTKNSAILNTSAIKQVNTLGSAALKSSALSLTLKMQQPQGMSYSSSKKLLQARGLKIQSALKKSGLDVRRISLQLTEVKGANTVSVTLNYQR